MGSAEARRVVEDEMKSQLPSFSGAFTTCRLWCTGHVKVQGTIGCESPTS